MTLTEFLLARIAEDEESVRDARITDCPEWWMPDAWSRDRALAECEAKRRIAARCSELIAEEEADHSGIQSPDYYGGQAQRAEDALATLAYLALPYADHPDYDEAWAV